MLLASKWIFIWLYVINSICVSVFCCNFHSNDNLFEQTRVNQIKYIYIFGCNSSNSAPMSGFEVNIEQMNSSESESRRGRHQFAEAKLKCDIMPLLHSYSMRS